MKKSKIFEWLALTVTALALLCAGLGLIILGNTGITSVAPFLKNNATPEMLMSWQYNLTYWFIFITGFVLFFIGFAVIAKLLFNIFSKK